MTTLNLQVGADADDTTVYNGTWYAAYQYFGAYDASGYVCNSSERFTNVTIAAGSTINSAALSFKASSGLITGTPCNLKIHCDDSDSATAPTSLATFNGKTLTTGVAWASVPAWTAGTWYSSADLSSEVQTVVNRAGWNSGQALQTFVKDDANAANKARVAVDYSASSAGAPKLDITYTAGGGGTTVKTLAATGVGG